MQSENAVVLGGETCGAGGLSQSSKNLITFSVSFIAHTLDASVWNRVKNKKSRYTFQRHI